MTDWVKRMFGKGDIDRAGAFLVPWWKGEVRAADLPKGEVGKAYAIAENWRTSHSMPLLTFRMNLGQRARRVEPGSLVAQRLKRFSSVMNKLVREPQMDLSQMQDLGGCRAILSSVDAVQKLYDLYREDGLLPFAQKMKCYDYIRSPKPDGYRGIHVVGRYTARFPKNEPWNGQRIEIQLRSKLQHAFSTAVETVTTFTRQPLKFGGGPDDWKRFFSLIGSALALREGTTLVPGTPKTKAVLIRELRDLTKALKVRPRLRGWTAALRQLPKRNTAGTRWRWLLLVLDVEANTIEVTGFEDRKKATQAVAAIERESRDGRLDAVLVWVRSIRDLRTAYPNYYADTTEFLDALDSALKA